MFESEIIKTMQNLVGYFSKNELAYLAFTSKVERPIRDKFAWIMYLKYENKKNYHVTREYGVIGERDKIDFAILDKKSNAPKCLIEFKAISVLPALNEGRTFKMMEEDFKKMKTFRGSTNSEKYFIQLVNIPKKVLCKSYECQIAPSHFKKINEYSEKNDPQKFQKQVIKKWEDNIEKLNYIASPCIILKAGDFYGNPMEILCWVIRKV